MRRSERGGGGGGEKAMIWNNSKKRECTEVSMPTLFPGTDRAAARREG